MGKRKKSSRAPASKKREPLDTVFKCLFCKHDKSVSCKIDDATRIGYLSCKVCGARFQTTTNPLTEPVDIYTDWLDATEEVNAGGGDD